MKPINPLEAFQIGTRFKGLVDKKTYEILDIKQPYSDKLPRATIKCLETGIITKKASYNNLPYMLLKIIEKEDNNMSVNVEEIKSQLNDAGYDYAVAIATKAEVEAGAACGQLSIIIEQNA